MSIIKHVTLQKIVAHDFRYDPRKYIENHKINVSSISSLHINVSVDKVQLKKRLSVRRALYENIGSA